MLISPMLHHLQSKIEPIPSNSDEEFESRSMKKVMEALRGECVVIIGVYVMGSVGKTTLVEEISQRVKQERLFNEVVMVTITQKPDLKRI